MQLVNTLQTSKITASEVTEQLETSETTEINIDLAREVSFRLSLEGRGPASRAAPAFLWPRLLTHTGAFRTQQRYR